MHNGVCLMAARHRACLPRRWIHKDVAADVRDTCVAPRGVVAVACLLIGAAASTLRNNTQMGPNLQPHISTEPQPFGKLLKYIDIFFV